jgi:NAD(P)-dependent dehydrogenase (short-subunit alcohol dehydrogenase family)
MAGLIEGKVAVITGAGSGAGLAGTVLFAQHGAKIVAADPDSALVDSSANIARMQGGSAIGMTYDPMDPAAIARVIESAVETYGRLDILYNNALIAPMDSGHDLSALTELADEDFESRRGINVVGILLACQAAVRQFEAQGGGGAIVNTASMARLSGYDGLVYGAPRGAVVDLTRTLALEVAHRGIRVNVICPSALLTGMAAMTPLGRIVTADDCARAALFLASDLAASITAVSLPVDAGLSARLPGKR